ncbi:TPA_exp: Uncharacterized protein A8136_7300 [Trichophyton benhamiae CBS 112371]|uniref:F-box domain protein n=1 Tax=Arthroderma benhamiae (strain ATCC MYA-4681 / CBS 112371) TaxID=663331 RepID=D4ATI0_ARTBC|nr:uncharacterized protein ARB_07544 [Trichophyton benhamiae CBS 112371]EFE33599.1 hypothetical protein ARB_07544 [Trichophyton benhamiae CBS 112371]DAA76623.1 TPA_exp: Uncharacterized protein A8136_7300 [Trichophyton benhamiae CBS 112371]
MLPSASFIRFWSTDLTRDAFLSQVSKEDLANLRLVCHDFSVHVEPILFSELDVSLRSSTFTRPARMAALERIGRHVKSLKLTISHSPSTFLPPLLDPNTGEEQTFVYTPQVYPSSPFSSRLSGPKYGTWEMTDLLTKQYPPLFHAATNIGSFIRAFKALGGLTKLTLSCPNQSAPHRYRRSVVDYALISIRCAVEHSPLPCLTSLTLLPVHPGALLYLRPTAIGIGTSPASCKRWRRITDLHIEMDAFPYSGGEPTDHLKFLDSYLQCFPLLKRLKFRWLGARGPSPLSLSTEPCLTTNKQNQFSSARPKQVKPLIFPSLHRLEIENVHVDASQVSSFIRNHRNALREINFEATTLRSGTWDDALAPLAPSPKKAKPSPSPPPPQGQKSAVTKEVEVMDVPLVLSAAGMEIKQLQRLVLEEAGRRKKGRRNKAGSSIRLWGRGKAISTVGSGSTVSVGSGTGAGSKIGYGQVQLQKATDRTRELLGCGPEHMRRLLRASVLRVRAF